MAPPFLAFESSDTLMAAAAERIAVALNRGIQKRGEACAALSGGSTPAPAYEKLAEKAVDWARVRFALVDERFVPPSSPDSNQGLALRTLQRPFSRGAMIAPLWAENATLQQAGQKADGVYAQLHIDIAVMGMGNDGHTASWFPDAARLREALDPNNPRSVMALSAASAAGSAERLTMTLSAMKRVEHVILLIIGEEKRGVYERALTSIAPSPIGALVAACGGRFEILWAA